MKVLFVSAAASTFYDAYVHRLASLRAGLDKLGVETEMLSLGDLPFKKPFVISPLNMMSLRRKFSGYDFIHAGNTSAAYLLSIARPFVKNCPEIIYDVHGDIVEEARLRRAGFTDLTNNFLIAQGRVMEAVARAHSDLFIVCSEALKEHYVSCGIEKDRIAVVLNGVNIDAFNGAGVPGHDIFTVAYAGRFQKWQGVDNFLRAAELLAHENIKFRIIGFQETDAKLKKDIAGTLDNVELIDSMPAASLQAFLKSSDGLAIPRAGHPALEVAFPTKYAEYLACGVPVIVTRVGDVARLTEKYGCGLVCDPTPEALADTIMKLKDMPAEKRAGLGSNGRKLAGSLLSYDHISAAYHDFLLNAYRERN